MAAFTCTIRHRTGWHLFFSDPAKCFIMKTLSALGGGLAGAFAVTLIHETVRRVVPEAPRMDLLGMNAIRKGLDKAGLKKPSDDQLFTWALVGDLVSNSLYYSMAGIGKDKNVWVRSALLGLAAGIGAVTLPGPMGLEERHSNKSLTTQVITVGLYVAGAVATAAVMKWLNSSRERRERRRRDVWEQRLVTSAMS